MLGLTKNVDYGLDLMIFLGKNFEEYCNNIKENHKDAEMMEI